MTISFYSRKVTGDSIRARPVEWWGLEQVLKGTGGQKLETGLTILLKSLLQRDIKKWGHHLTRTVLEVQEGDSLAAMGLRESGK